MIVTMESMKVRTDPNFRAPKKREFLVLIPFALFYCAAAMLGQLEKAADLSMLHNLARAFLWMCGSYAVLLALNMALSNREVIASYIPFLADKPAGRQRSGKWYVWFFFTAVCLICYLPYFLMYYPTWLNNDAIWQIEQVLGTAARSNHHPYFHTLILKGLFLTGYRLSGTYTGGAAFYTFFQVLIMAMVFGFFLFQLYKKGTGTVWMVLALVFYAVLPINGILTICMGKDEFFTASLLLFTWTMVAFDLDITGRRESALEQTILSKTSGEEENTKEDTAYKRKRFLRWTACFVTGLLVCLLRSNGIFIFVGTSFFLLLSRMRKGKFPVRTFLCVAAVLLCYLIYRGPILTAWHVEQPDTIEGLTMPTQHVLCAYLKGGTLTEEEIAMIDRVVPVEEVGDYYNPWLFDLVKNFIRSEGNQQAIADHKWEYFKLWFRVGLRNPLQYLVAQVRQTAGYWAYSVKDYEYVYGEYYMVDNPFGITAQRKLFSYDAELAMHDFLMGFQDFYNKVWSLGRNTWLMVFLISYLVYNKRSMLIYVPFIMLLFTLLLATPVYNEFRYAYGLFAAFPILFSYNFGKET